jgi:hypothetical protein
VAYQVAGLQRIDSFRDDIYGVNSQIPVAAIPPQKTQLLIPVGPVFELGDFDISLEIYHNSTDVTYGYAILGQREIA